MAADLTRALLLYRAGQARDFRLPDGEAILGFGAGSAVHLPMEGVSRSHAKITFDGKDYWIEDLGSSNGTFLNGIPVVVRERLRHLDVLSLGRHTDLIFVRRTMEHARVTRLGIQGAWLEMLNGEESGTRVEIPRGSLTIGRSPSNGVVADSQLVSKIHARLERTAVQIVLTDLHSSNGTFMGNERIESRVLKDKDEFTLGGSRTFRIHIQEGDVETSGVTPAATVRSGAEQSLPSDWKTRIEWSPEEIAVWEDARRKVRLADTASRRGAPSGAAPVSPKGATPPAPAAKPPAPSASAPARGATAKAPPVKPESKPPEPLVASEKAGSAARPAAVPSPTSERSPAVPATSLEKAAAAHAEAKAAPSPSGPPRPEAPPAQDRTQAPTTAIPAVAEAPAPPSTQAGSVAWQPEAGPLVFAAAPASVDVTQALAEEAAKPRVLLEGKARTFSLPVGDHEVGRLPGMAICLDGPQISRHHAVVRVTDRDVVVEDLRSGNGTFVNMERITAPRRLGHGDLLQFGDIAFHVCVSSEPGDNPKT